GGPGVGRAAGSGAPFEARGGRPRAALGRALAGAATGGRVARAIGLARPPAAVDGFDRHVVPRALKISSGRAGALSMTWSPALIGRTVPSACSKHAPASAGPARPSRSAHRR